MNELFMHPTLSLLTQLAIHAAYAYTIVLGLWTFRKLPECRNVARALSLLISIVGLMYICANDLPTNVDCSKGPIHMTQVVDVLNAFINIVTLRLLLRPAFVEDEKSCREIA